MSLHHSISAGFHESIVITEILKSFQDNHTNIACVLFGFFCTAPLCWCLLNFLFNELFMAILPCCFPLSSFFTSCHSEISHAVMELSAISSRTIYLLDLWFWVTVWLSSPVWGNSLFWFIIGSLATSFDSRAFPQRFCVSWHFSLAIIDTFTLFAQLLLWNEVTNERCPSGIIMICPNYKEDLNEFISK